MYNLIVENLTLEKDERTKYLNDENVARVINWLKHIQEFNCSHSLQFWSIYYKIMPWTSGMSFYMYKRLYNYKYKRDYKMSNSSLVIL